MSLTKTTSLFFFVCVCGRVSCCNVKVVSLSLTEGVFFFFALQKRLWVLHGDICCFMNIPSLSKIRPLPILAESYCKGSFEIMPTRQIICSSMNSDEIRSVHVCCELRKKSFHYLLEEGRLLFESGFGLCHLSGPHSFLRPRIRSTALRKTAYSSSHSSLHGVVRWVWRMQ